MIKAKIERSKEYILYLKTKKGIWFTGGWYRSKKKAISDIKKFDSVDQQGVIIKKVLTQREIVFEK